jgi:hypothetical protein
VYVFAIVSQRYLDVIMRVILTVTTSMAIRPLEARHRLADGAEFPHREAI